VGFVNVEGAFKILSYSFLLHFSSDLYKIRDRRLYKTSFSNCNFRENLCCENHTVLKVVNKSLHVYSTLIFRFGFNSVYACAHNFVSFTKIGAEKAPFSFVRN
jgi:hypothetical protein